MEENGHHDENTRSGDWCAVMPEALTGLVLGAVPYALVFLCPIAAFGRAFESLSLMRHRNPLPFKAFFIAVNFAQVLLCARVIYLIFDSDFLSGFEFYCRPSNLTPKESKSIFSACWYYHLSNIIAVIDTVYMKIYEKRVTFLHVYHHSSALVWSWIVAKRVPGGRSFFSVLGISVAHLAIYLYYLTALIGVRFNRRLCWTALTLLQISLIALGIIHMSMVFLGNCQYPKSVAAIYITFSSILLFFFLKLYAKRSPRKIR